MWSQSESHASLDYILEWCMHMDRKMGSNRILNAVTARFIACYTLLHVPAIFLDTLTTSPFSRLSSSSSLAWKSWMASTRHSCTVSSPILCVVCTTRSIGILPQWRSCSFSPSHHSEVKMKGLYMYSSTYIYIPLLYSLWMIWSRAWNSVSNTSSKLVTGLLNYSMHAGGVGQAVALLSAFCAVIEIS